MSLTVLIVDDEALARERLRKLLADCSDPSARVVGEAANAVQAMEAIQRDRPQALLLDIHMPGVDGIGLARALQQLPEPPAVIFVTAFAEHAVKAFELEAVDYLTKPVRLARLQVALQKIRRIQQIRAENLEESAPDALIIQERGSTERVPLDDVLYLKAELKYVTVRTATRSYILNASLNELEERHAAWFLRVHRNALVARRAVRALEKLPAGVDGEGWTVRLEGLDECLPVSRRQLAQLREVISG